MKVVIKKAIKVTEVGPHVLQPGDAQHEVSEGCGKVLIEKGFAEEVDSKPLSATDAIKLVETATTLEDLKPFEADERATVIKAVETKKAELIA